MVDQLVNVLLAFDKEHIVPVPNTEGHPTLGTVP